jgi:hypothetical protein
MYKTVEIQSERLARMVVAYLEKRSDDYSHSKEYYHYNEPPKVFLT